MENRGFKIINNELVGDEVTLRRDAVSIGELIYRALRTKPEIIGQIDGISGEQCTYQEMREKSVKCARWMKKQGIEAHDIVGVCAENISDAYIPLFATLYLNAVLNTWDEELTITTARYFLALTKPKIVFVSAHSAANLKEAAKQEQHPLKIVVFDELAGFETLAGILEDDAARRKDIDSFECTKIESPYETAMICCSSGTTGPPKGTEISHFSFINYIYNVAIKDVRGHICLWLPTIRWHYGLCLQIKATLDYAPRIVVHHYVDGDLLCQIVEKYKVTYIAAGPFLVVQLLKKDLFSRYRMPSLKILLIGGCPFKKEHQIAARNALPHTYFVQSFGMTDLGGLACYQHKDSKPGSCGFICKAIRIKMVDTATGRIVGPNEQGELWIKSPYAMNGYYKNPEATKECIDADGYLHSSDIGYYDQDGEIFVVGRISDFILYKCINVPPLPIEALLENHPAVLEAAVVSVPHELDYEHPMAFVRKVPGKEVSAQELIKLVEDNLEYYSRLRAGIVFVDQFPRTVTRKMSRKKLKEIAHTLWKK